jgi:hypothetical protein
LDTQITQDESLELTNALKPSLYLNASNILISTGSEVYSLEISPNLDSLNPFVFQYSYSPSPPFILGDGYGLIGENPVADATASIPVTPEMESIDIELNYTDQNNVSITLDYSDLLYISPELLLSNLEGQWGQFVFDANGILSGNINDCDFAGNINDFQEKVALTSMTVSNCGQAGNYSGVVVGVDNSVFGSTNDAIVIILFNDDGSNSFFGIIGKSN